MSRGLPKQVRENLEKCREAVIAAVDAYNRPGPRFRTAQYLVMITIAWTAIFHAYFYRQGRRPWYRRNPAGIGKAVRYVKVDGDPKHWDLTECLKQFHGPEHPPERKNLQFLLGLRNKIEHRHLPQFDASLYGECQAALINIEEMIVAEFGKRYALTEHLAVALQFSRITPPEKKKAAQILATSSVKSVKDYIERFRGGLPSTVLTSMKYSFNVFLVPRVANRKSAADAAVEFIRVDEASEEELDRLARLNVLIREKHIPIANLDFYKPSQVVAAMKKRVPFSVSMATHTAAWKHFRIRPPSGDKFPERTQGSFCVYDHVHGDYLYTPAWIEKLVVALSDPKEFEVIVGRKPVPKQ